MEKIFRIFGKIITMYKNMMDSMKKPATMESKKAQDIMPPENEMECGHQQCKNAIVPNHCQQ